jgi:hypothetical protein
MPTLTRPLPPALVTSTLSRPLATVAGQPTLFFLTANAGAGKTYVPQALPAWTSVRRPRTASIASRGLAAQLLPGGTTAPRRLGVLLDDQNVSNITSDSLRGFELIHMPLVDGSYRIL